MEITPNGLQKELTTLLSELVFDTGFKKKKIGWLTRKVGECEQFFTITFTRDRGLPGNLYSVNFTLSFTYKEVDRLTSLFLGMEYDPKWSTGAWMFYTQIPNYTMSTFKYCSDEPMQTYAERIANYFRKYALPYYEKIDTLEKVAKIFEQTASAKDSDKARNFFVVRRLRGSEGDCCYAAILCVQGKWNKLRDFLPIARELSIEEKERIEKYISDK